ncbi:MAG: VCBS repeat-containing protein, partial [Chthonomonadales bacterium]
MKLVRSLLFLTAAAGCVLVGSHRADTGLDRGTAWVAKADEITWKKIVLDTEFRAEGVCVADVNKDGKMDVLAGNVWYEAPNWTPHEIRPIEKFDGAHGYSKCFLSWAMDVNGDGWADQVIVGFPGEPAVWRENPKGKPGPWAEHIICA